MKILAAFTLIVISMASAEPPRYRPVLARQGQSPDTAPYNPSGWRPSGPPFNTPQRQQNYLPPEPKPSYGPPQEPQPSYGPPEVTTTENPTTTTEVTTETAESNDAQAEAIKVDPRTGKVSAALKSAESPQPGAYFVVLPRVESKAANLVAPVVEQKVAFVAPFTQSYVVPLAEVPRKTAALVSAIPAPLQVQRIVPFNSAYRNEIYTPFSSSIVQIYQ
ncbi:proteoglycan 4-like isoform X2 [Harmonia axyridis]|uniref:proteoglycan 4-like isoform X2 n=1 Tax=Harmonia axyridis TaxID=115357 RepID=UPI001E276F86|nr:proteoglycan 4-like isoform X2 [Harmonia axyridis]